MKQILLLINNGTPPYGTFAEMFKAQMEASGQFAVTVSEDRDSLRDPGGFDAVALYILGGELTPEQERGITGFVRGGGGVLAVHGANAGGLAKHEAYIEMIGTEFIGHDPLAPFQVETDPECEPILPRLRRSFPVVDECYNMKLRTDAPLTWFQHGTWRMERKPLGYVRDYGAGKLFYTALGHDHRTFRNPDFQDQLFKGLRYVTGLEDRAPIRIGLVGYGPQYQMGKHHSGMIAQTPGFELVAVCDRDPARLQAAREEQGEGGGRPIDIATFTDAAEMAAGAAIDLGIVILPHVLHAPVIRTLLEAGKHVITEKPFVIHVSDADELIALASEKGRMLSVYHNRHWDPDILTLRSIVEAGTIGDLYSMECNMVSYGNPGQEWRSQKEVSGGLLYDMGAHQFEKILQLVPWTDRRGNPINRRAGLYGNFLKRVWHGNSNEEFARAYVRFDSGLEAQLLQSNIHAASKPLWTVCGTRGSVVVEGWDGAAVVTTAGDDGRLSVMQVPPVSRPGWGGYYKNVADHLLSGAPLTITAKWARGPIQCIEGCETAARENRLVEVEFDF
jgi:predicted dehydrogenase/type 1 glutamine amidotransferase